MSKSRYHVFGLTINSDMTPWARRARPFWVRRWVCGEKSREKSGLLTILGCRGQHEGLCGAFAGLSDAFNMGKGRMTLLDVRAIAKELRSGVLGMRALNIYHLSARTYLFKMNGAGKKSLLVIESGIRVHETKYDRPKESAPNQFAAKLRKHVRGVRLTAVRQAGTDRVIDLQFGQDERAHHIIVELYGQGNIILTSHDYKIIMLLRTYEVGGTKVAVGETFKFSRVESAEDAKMAISPNALDRIFRAVLRPAEPEAKRAGDAKAAVQTGKDQAGRPSKGDAAAAQAAAEDALLKKADPVLYRKIKRIEDEMARTQRNKATNAHLMNLRSKLAKLKRKLGWKGRTAAAAAAAAGGDAAPQTASETDASAQAAAAPPAPAPRRRSRSPGRRKKQKSKVTPWSTLCRDLPFGPQIVAHCLATAGFDPKSLSFESLGWNGSTSDPEPAGPAVEAPSFNKAALQSLSDALAPAIELMETVSTSPLPGFLVCRPPKANKKGGTGGKKKPKMSRSERRAKAKAEAEIKAQEEERKRQSLKAKSDSTEAQTDKATSSTPAPAAQTGATDGATTTEGKSKGESKAKSENESLKTTENTVPEGWVFSEFMPLRLQGRAAGNTSQQVIIEFPTLTKAMDEFFSKIEMQKDELQTDREKANARDKVERVKRDHAARLAKFDQIQLTNVKKAEILTAHVELAQRAREAVLTSLAQGMDWSQIQELVDAQKEAGNPIALSIARLDLARNRITLQLPDPESEAGDAPQREAKNYSRKKKLCRVDLDLDLNVYQMISQYYKTKKQAIEKRARTEQASSKAIKAAERKMRGKLRVVDMKQTIKKARKVHWWEKFSWFVSSENYLVISGRNSQQNEQLVKKYLGKNDLYMHAEVHGAATTVIKNPSGRPVPPKTLVQAASMTVCHSSAWNSKVPVNAYWVHADQVSKQAPSGEYLPSGSFMVRGRRNFINRAPMMMAFGLMFRVDAHCETLHAGERRPTRVAEDERGGVGDKSQPENSKRDGKGEQKQKQSTRENKQDKSDLQERKTEEAEKESKSDRAVDSVVKNEDEAVLAPDKPKTVGTDTASPSPEADDDDVTMQFLSFGGGMAGEEANDDEEKGSENDSTSVSSEQRLSKKRISRAERRRMKKQTTRAKTGDAKIVDSTSDGAQAKTQLSGAAAGVGQPRTKDKSNKGPKHVPLPRGKRTKAKRTKMKYKDQDEEDYKIAAKLLGLKPSKDRKSATETSPENDTPNGDNDDEKPGAADPGAKNRGDRPGAAGPRGDRKQPSPAVGGDVVPVQDASDRDLDILTGKPLSPAVALERLGGKAASDDGDDKPLPYNILYAVPVCAPLAAISDYKYKVKIIPGKMKTGKACKQCIEIFQRNGDCTPLEKDLIKALDVNKMALVMMKNCKVVPPSGGGRGRKGGGRRRKK